jgi:hypothetical protein
VRCASGELGPVGQNIAAMIGSGREDEIYEVSGHSVLWHVRERSPVGNRDAYCETTFTASWEANNVRIRDSGTKLKSRESVHGYKCYEPFKAPPPEPPSEHTYELNGNLLGIHHPDPEVKVKDRTYHGCQDGSDLVFELERR